MAGYYSGISLIRLYYVPVDIFNFRYDGNHFYGSLDYYDFHKFITEHEYKTKP